MRDGRTYVGAVAGASHLAARHRGVEGQAPARCIEVTRHFLACCIAAVSLLASPFAPAQVAVSGPYWPGPAVSGSWYDPARSGEGLILQFLPTGKALVIWFTYPPAGEAAEQAWLITELGSVDGLTTISVTDS